MSRIRATYFLLILLLFIVKPGQSCKRSPVTCKNEFSITALKGVSKESLATVKHLTGTVKKKKIRKPKGIEDNLPGLIQSGSAHYAFYIENVLGSTEDSCISHHFFSQTERGPPSAV